MQRSFAALVLCLAFVYTSPADARPRQWCGWWMQQHTGITSKMVKRNLNLAREWAHVGTRASGPGPGVIGVSPHHVVQVLKVVSPGRILAISGNDGRAVRTRVRSTRGIFAWRRISPSTTLALAEPEAPAWPQ